jgi:aminoglycoside 6-adenylyltransferase
MRTQDLVLKQLEEWASNTDLVRAAILISTRANPKRNTDFLSDYDVELYVADLGPFQTNDLWLTPFGAIMARWPLKPCSTFDEKWITRGIIFRDGVRIDFQITDLPAITSEAYDDDYRVLVDKDGLTSGLKPPTLSKHLARKPTKAEYEALTQEFWWDAHYVPKYLWRDELPYAASMLGQAVRDEYLRTVIEWFIGLQNNWSVNTGVRGRKFKSYLDERTWSEYESTFAGPGIEENWQAFFNAVALFRRTAVAVGETLGYEYPSKIDREMTEYYRRIQSTKKDTRNSGGHNTGLPA